MLKVIIIGALLTINAVLVTVEDEPVDVFVVLESDVHFVVHLSFWHPFTCIAQNAEVQSSHDGGLAVGWHIDVGSGKQHMQVVVLIMDIPNVKNMKTSSVNMFLLKMKDNISQLFNCF